MALTSTLYRIQIDLSDIDRNLYESLELRVPLHPSEDLERLGLRLLAYAMSYEDGLEFGRGLSSVEDPTIFKKEFTGEVNLWIDVGAPSAERLHRANKKAKRLVVFSHKNDDVLQREWKGKSIYQAEKIEVLRIQPDFLREWALDLERNDSFFLTVQDDGLLLTKGDRCFQTQIWRGTLVDFLE